MENNSLAFGLNLSLPAFAPISKDEQLALARTIRAAGADPNSRTVRKAKEKLLYTNLRYVDKMVRDEIARLESCGFPGASYEDMFSSAFIALNEAIEAYDPDKDCVLLTSASRLISNAIDEVVRQHTGSQLKGALLREYTDYKNMVNILSEALGRNPSYDEIEVYSRGKFSKKRITELEMRGSTPACLDDEVCAERSGAGAEETEETLGDFIVGEGNVADYLSRKEELEAQAKKEATKQWYRRKDKSLKKEDFLNGYSKDDSKDNKEEDK